MTTLRVDLQQRFFFPGQCLNGVLHVSNGNNPVNVTSLCVMVIVDLLTRWTTTTRHTSGSGKRRRTRTVTHHHSRLTVLVKHLIPVVSEPFTLQPNQQSNFPFYMVLSPQSLPSIALQKCMLQYRVVGQLNTTQSVSQPVPFQVLLPMSQIMHDTPSGRTHTQEIDLVCCGCCACCGCACKKGKIEMRAMMSRTVVALDRDTIAVQVDLDNSKGEADVSTVIVALHANVNVKVGHICSTVEIAGRVETPANCPAGKQSTVNVVVPLKPTAAPSFQSPVVDVTYKLSVTLNMSWADNKSLGFDCFAANSVDMTNMCAQFQSGYQALQLPGMQFTGDQQQPNFDMMQPVMMPMQSNAPPPTNYNCPVPQMFFSQELPTYQAYNPAENEAAAAEAAGTGDDIEPPGGLAIPMLAGQPQQPGYNAMSGMPGFGTQPQPQLML